MGTVSHRQALLAIVAVVVLAGCTGLPGSGEDRTVSGELGEVDNVTYDTELDIDFEAGVSEAELERFVKRTMARIEAVREKQFDRTVDVEVITREEYRERRSERTRSPVEVDWENQFWRGLFIVGDDRDATALLEEAFGEGVQGFYEPGEERIVIVSDSETPTINKATLVHELVHALQAQQFGLEFGHDSFDEGAAYDTLIEGEADLVPELYLEEWCEEWDCLRPELAVDSGGTDGVALDPGIVMVITQPYAQGVEYVTELRAAGGWEAVDQRHEEPPRSTAETMFDVPASTPLDISVTDRSDAEWSRLEHSPDADRLGAAALYAMFAANGVIDNEEPTNYAHPVVEGWAGDQFVPYRNDDEFGYVWELAWESSADAEQFAETYRELLQRHDALPRGERSYVISDGPFAGAYRLTVQGEQVRIVNAPDVGALSAVHDG